MIKIYHNPRCRKSREALALLKEKGDHVVVQEYLKEPPTKEELREIVSLLEIRPFDLIRKSENEYKDNFKGKNLSDEEWLDAMIAYPKLIERPIVINERSAIIGRPPENVLSIL